MILKGDLSLLRDIKTVLNCYGAPKHSNTISWGTYGLVYCILYILQL